MAQSITIFGAGGKMGCRIASNLRNGPNRLLCVEINHAGADRLKGLGFGTVTHQQGVEAAEITILAVPDALIGEVTASFLD